MRIPDSRRRALSPSRCPKLLLPPLPSRRCLLLAALVLQLLALALLLPRLPPIPRHLLSANPPPRNSLPHDSLPRALRGKRAEERVGGGEEVEGLEDDGAWRLYQRWRGDLLGGGDGGGGREGGRKEKGDGEGEAEAGASRSLGEDEAQQQRRWQRCGGVGDAASMRSAAGMMADDTAARAMGQQAQRVTAGEAAGSAVGSGRERFLMVEVNGGLNQQRTAPGILEGRPTRKASVAKIWPRLV
ncbi:hypothetical protein CLOP_g727 [Closterium sp. NIES-67]|nr:hypothetical protein CLOP_g727 [Closterium sp. NIES-67]